VSQEGYVIIVLVAMGIAILVLAGALLGLARRHRELEKSYTRMFEGVSGDNLAENVLRHLAELEENARELAELREHTRALQVGSREAIRHVGLVRYNPFDDMGGDYSVALTLADAEGRGIVLSSLHGRTATRLYVRTLQDWASSNPLSSEEQEAIRIAREGNGQHMPATDA